MPKMKIKSTDILKETSKNSYSNKYLEEHSRIRLNKKNCSNISNLKVKFESKEIGNSSNKNLKLSHKKGKNNSMEKINKSEFRNDFLGDNIYCKKKTRNLNNSFNENNNNDNINQKFSKTISQLSLYKNIYNNSIKLTKSRSKKSIKEKTVNNDSKIIKLPEIKNLTPKEKACLILSYSNCLRLCERAIFSRSSPKFQSIISKKQILEINKIYLTEKLQEIEKKIDICNTKLKSKFNASKTAEITLNFITLTIETDFKLNFFENIDDEIEKKYCINYVKLLYLVLGESYDEVPENDLIKNLYSKIEEKHYNNIKDYLFYLYIQNHNENKAFENIDKINEIISTTPDILNFKISTKFDKFILYCSYILYEIINFANNRIDTIKLVKDCKNFIDIINLKLNLYSGKSLQTSNPINKKNI